MIPRNLKKTLAALDPLPRTVLRLLTTSGLTPLTGQKIHQLLHAVGFVHVINRTNRVLGELIEAGHVIEIRADRKPRRYRIAGKYLHQSGIVHTGKSAP